MPKEDMTANLSHLILLYKHRAIHPLFSIAPVKPCPDKRTRPSRLQVWLQHRRPENQWPGMKNELPDGLVKGSYSYVDPMGKLQVIHYESHQNVASKPPMVRRHHPEKCVMIMYKNSH
ncbi:hypothetical protein CEXT_581731 [Caerostris extrusa]|uniref:Uncharacterized protein n=1 Tax=Caerostris extrusa TaxID=172846 RepID=A0AAV4R0Q0_CAEEX|nr:hypothetical protein CEXT_581731 [Caerostris extrusa]